MNTYRIPIKELFKILDLDDLEYETPILNRHDIRINSLSGFVKINAFVKKRHKTAEYVLGTTSIACSINHLVFSGGVPKKIKDCNEVDTVDGPMAIHGVIDGCVEDVYDVALDSPHQYVTPNGVIHHNTTLAKILFTELDINPLDILEINASRTNSVDDVRDKIINFVQMIPFGDFKVVLLDEADYLSHHAQAALRGVMEEYHTTARFVLTCVTGETKIITPEGTKTIDSIKDNTKVLSFTQFLTSKTIKKSITNKVVVIQTMHGNKITTTLDHKFFTFQGEKKAGDLKVGDYIPYYIDSVYGNNFEAEKINYKECFSKSDFYAWLLKKGILSNYHLEQIKNYKCFVFNHDHQEIFNFIIENNLSDLDLVDISNTLNKTRNCVRNLLAKIKKYIIKQQYVSQSKYIYVVDIDQIKTDYAEFSNFISSNNIEIRHINKFLKTSNTAEKIIDQLEFDEFNSDLLLSIGRLIGFIEGDGHLSTTLHIAANNELTLKKVHADIIKFVNVKYNCTKNGINSKGLCSYYNNKALKLFLEYLGATVGNKTKIVRNIPDLSKYKLFFKGYLQGLYDSDGKRIKILKDDKTISPILLTQSIIGNSQLSFFTQISNTAKHHFGLNLETSIKNSDVSTFGGSPIEMHLYSGKSSQIKLFLESIGHYYDKEKNADLLGYLFYKEQQKNYNFLTFSEWKNNFYGHGIINDQIISIQEINEKTEVYDCCLEEVHWYLTNGFMSHNCNYPNKIIPAIHSRCQGFHIAKIDKTEFTARVAEILISEGVTPDLDILDTYVKATYPDLRKCINTVQMNSQDGVLVAPHEGDTGSTDWKLKMVELFKAGKIQEARKLLCGTVRPEEMDEIYRWLYSNIELFGETEEKQDQAVLIIKQGLVDHTLVCDPEINLAAVLIKLARNAE